MVGSVTPLVLASLLLAHESYSSTPFLQQSFGIAPQHSPLHPSHISAEQDASILFDDFLQPGGTGSFANLPHIQNCYSHHPTAEKYDIAILGAPFDTGTTARPGARFGPKGIRAASYRMKPEFMWDIFTGNNTFKSGYKIVDCGDAPVTWLDNTVALRYLEKAHKLVSARESERGDAPPRIVMLGGDHLTTLAALRSTYKHWGPVSVIHFDSHLDTWDPAVLGGGLSHYAGINHGTFLHIAHEEGLISNTSSMHVGIRAPMASRRRDLKNDAKCGFGVVTAREIDRVGIQGVVERIKERVGGGAVYVSADIDVLDLAFAPATGTPEPGGWSTRELLTVLGELSGLKVIGGDVVEVAPDYDTQSQITSTAAAEIAVSLLTLMVETPVLPPAEVNSEL